MAEKSQESLVSLIQERKMFLAGGDGYVSGKERSHVMVC